MNDLILIHYQRSFWASSAAIEKPDLDELILLPLLIIIKNVTY